MEIFLPSLIIFVVLAFFIFLVLPRTGPMVLAVVCLIALIAAGMNHYTMFYSEYALSTWQYSLAAYTPWVILGLALIFVISAAMFMFSGGDMKGAMNAVTTPMESIQEAVANSAAAMPSAASATNVVTATLNRAMNGPAGGNSSAPAPGAGFGFGNNKKNNAKSPVIPGLGFAASDV
jgi:hypothetical protein